MHTSASTGNIEAKSTPRAKTDFEVLRVSELDEAAATELVCSPLSGVPTPGVVDAVAGVLPASGSDGAPVALIRADQSARRHRELVASAVAVNALALENARLQASLRAQLLEVAAARTRLLQSGFAQRRQLERDLHDGAQQRLLAIGMRLAALQETAPDAQTRDAVRAAKAELHEAMAELRDLAHGIYPVVLAQGGLAAALESVAERMPLTVRVNIPNRRWPPHVEGVAYLIACEALTNAVKHANATAAELTVQNRPGQLRLTVTDHGQGWDQHTGPPDLPDLSDRLTALGGQLHIDTSPTGTIITATIPIPDES